MVSIRIRVIVGIMIFLGYFLIYLVRYNLSVHIVDLGKFSPPKKLVTNITDDDDDTIIVFIRGSPKVKHALLGEIQWDDWKVSYLFCSYHIGFCICFPIFHNVGDRVGPTWVVGIAGVFSGLLNCVTPLAAPRCLWCFIVIRVLLGFCAGAMQPSMMQLLRHWVPPVERNYFMWSYCGVTLGTASTFILCAAIQYYSHWFVGFYAVGAIQIFWGGIWLAVITDYPHRHPCIPNDELKFLRNAIGNTFTIKLTNHQTPWNLIVRSVPFWAVCFLNFGYAWIIVSLCLYGPLFYSRVAGYTIYAASWLTAIPFLLRLILGTVLVQLLHWYKVNVRNEVRMRRIRKVFIFFSHVVPGLLMVSSWMGTYCPGPVLLTIGIALTAAGMDLTIALCYEMSPNYGNSINTVIRIIGNIPGIVVPISVGQNTTHVWKHIWCFHALVLLISGLIFLLWGDTTVQSWNSVKNRRRPPRVIRPLPRPSTMSNIAEVDEDESVNRLTFPPKRSSFLSKTFRMA